MLGHTEAADLLQETLDEEKAADEKLSSLAEDGINQEAAHAAHPEEDDEVEAAPPVVARNKSSKSPAVAKASRR